MANEPFRLTPEEIKPQPASSTTFAKPYRLTPSEIESLRARQREAHAKMDEFLASEEGQALMKRDDGHKLAEGVKAYLEEKAKTQEKAKLGTTERR